MKNTGKGETSTIEKEEVDEPIEITNRNDLNKLKNMEDGDKLKIIPIDTCLYKNIKGYWSPMTYEENEEKEIKLKKGEIVTYKGKYETFKDVTTDETIAYLKVITEDELEGYVKLSTVELVINEKTNSNEKNKTAQNTNIKITSRAGAEDKTIGKSNENYVVAIAAGRNNEDEKGIVNEEKKLKEEELTIKVAEKVENLLKEYTNIKVVQTGSTSKNPNGIKNKDRAQKAKDLNPNLCIQIFFGDGEDVGVQTIYREGDDISKQLAEILSENMSTLMEMDNLGAEADTEKCKDSEGNSASLTIIDNAAVTGFPSVVAIGGNLNKDPDASIIAGDGVNKYAQAIVDSIDKYFKADHFGRTATEIDETTYKDSTESRIINMEYVEPEKFQEYIDNGDIEKALKFYTIDDERNLVVATWSKEEDGNIELQSKSSVNLKTALKKYVMPYEYLLFFYIDTSYKDFIYDLEEEIMKSEIVMVVQDNITTTNTVDVTKQRKEASVDSFSEGWHETNTKETNTESVSTSVNVTYAKTWCVKAYQENSYSQEVLQLEDEEEKIIEVPGKVTETTSNSATSENVVGKGVGTYNGTYIETERDANGNNTQIVKYYDFTIYEQTITDTHTISNVYDSGEYKTEGRENVFVDLYNKHNMKAKVRTSDYLFKIIENNERTANLLDLTKYLIYKATNIPWGVLEFDYSVFDVRQRNNDGSLGGLSTFIEYLHAWEGTTGISEDGTKYIVGDDGAGHPTVGYGIDIYNSGFLDRFLAAGYDVSMGAYIDVEFVDALEKEEVENAIAVVEEKTSGLNLTQYQKYALVSRIYNCGSAGAFTTRNGKDFVTAYNSYWDQEKDDEYKVTTNESMYNHPLYQNYMNVPVTSNGGYLAGLENRRKSEWILFKTGYYDRIDKWCSNSSGGAIVEKAVECHEYLRNNGYVYAQAGINIPITSSIRTVDCSSYVSWVLYEAGFSEFEGYQKTSYVFFDNPWGWQEVSVSEAQPGDIVIYDGHVEIVAGDAGDRFVVYNCGGETSISAEGTEELPESSNSGHTKSQIQKILRVPQ